MSISYEEEKNDDVLDTIDNFRSNINEIIEKCSDQRVSDEVTTVALVVFAKLVALLHDDSTDVNIVIPEGCDCSDSQENYQPEKSFTSEPE